MVENINKIKSQFPLVVIFGRTNVGKSTLFNKLIEKNKALVSDIEGTTRDSNVHDVDWCGKKITVVDTGGIMDITKFLKGQKSPTIENKVQNQVKFYLKNADLVLFVADAKTGILSDDVKIALLLKKMGLKNSPILVVNKVDNPKIREQTAEFNKLALGEPILVSAATGSGTGDLLDLIIKKFGSQIKKEPDEEKKDIINIAILGQPNVGKSSLVNSILGEEKIIVSPIPHTTREPQDTLIEYNGRLINLIDTAGISKQGAKKARQAKLRNTLEKKSINKSLDVLKKAAIVLLIIDLERGISHQDSKIAEEALKRKLSLIIIANKWDLIKEKDTKAYTQYVYNNLPFIKWAPIQFTSALTGSKVQKILDLVLEIDNSRKTEISPSALENFIKQLIKRQPPHRPGLGKRPHIFELVQTKANPPKFKIRIRTKDIIQFAYLKYIENNLRRHFGFTGTPLTIEVIKKSI